MPKINVTDGTISESKKLKHIVKCMKAMEIYPELFEEQKVIKQNYNTEQEHLYNPYKDYGQALKLVERYYLTVSRNHLHWMASPSVNGIHFRHDDILTTSKDIRVAIVECASQLYDKLEALKIQKEKLKKFK